MKLQKVLTKLYRADNKADIMNDLSRDIHLLRKDYRLVMLSKSKDYSDTVWEATFLLCGGPK